MNKDLMFQIKLKSRKMKCAHCGDSKGSIGFYFLHCNDGIEPYHKKCKDKVLEIKDKETNGNK